MLNAIRMMIVASLLVLAPTVACAADGVASEYYEVHHTDGRVYAFGEFKVYQDFLQGKELAYTLARIGKGPGNKTLIFGMTKSDAGKDVNGLPYVRFQEGRAAASQDGFYGEIFKDGRHYVFTHGEEMNAFRTSGEAAYVFTRVAWGPERRTVVFVQTKAESKAQPTATMERFRALHGV